MSSELTNRLKSGSTLLVLILTSFFVSGEVGAGVFLLLCGFLLFNGMKEFFTFTSKMGFEGYAVLFIPASFLYLIWTAISGWLKLPQGPFVDILLIISLITAGFVLVFKEKDLKHGLLNLMISIAGFFYIAWTLSFIIKIFFIDGIADTGRYLTLFFILATKCADIGAYFVGSASARRPGGNHKMLPRLSPKKSWEGFAGGIMLSMIVGLTLYFSLGKMMVVHGQSVLNVVAVILFAVLFASLGFIGDIAESLFKRSTGMKDSGSILPGMGGAMDVLDSLIFVAPIFYAYIRLVCM